MKILKSSESNKKKMGKKILLIDFYNLFIRAYNAVPATNADGEHYGGVFGTLRGLKVAIDQFKPTHVYVISDGPNAALRRKVLLKDYKGNRKTVWKRGAVRAFDFLNEKEQKDNYSKQVKITLEYLRVLPIQYLCVPYIEADDIIAEIVNTKDEDTEAVIYSSDSDYHQLISDTVVCYNPTAKKLWNKESFFAKHGFIVDNYIYFKIICGDNSDNVFGIKGVGEKTFIKMFPTVVTDKIENRGELIEIAQHTLDCKVKLTPAYKKKIEAVAESKILLDTNWELMQLLDANIGVQTQMVVQKFLKGEPNTFSRFGLQKKFLKDKLEGNVKHFNDWPRVFMALIARKKML